MRWCADISPPLSKCITPAVERSSPGSHRILVRLPSRCENLMERWHPAAKSLPDTGCTPDALSLSGTYNPAIRQSDLAGSELTDADVVEHELRASAGPGYDADDETILETFAPNAPRTWSGSCGLQLPGTAASMRISAPPRHPPNPAPRNPDIHIPQGKILVKSRDFKPVSPVILPVISHGGTILIPLLCRK